MKKHHLFALWGGLFALCAALGFIRAPGSVLQVLMTLLSVVFFLPGALLLRLAQQSKDRNLVLLVRNLSVSSLVLTAVLIIANFLSAFGSPILGRILHAVLVIVSAPMICSGYWALSLFLWACLMIGSIKILATKKNS